jgi:hypothetical protein
MPVAGHACGGSAQYQQEGGPAATRAYGSTDNVELTLWGTEDVSLRIDLDVIA